MNCSHILSFIESVIDSFLQSLINVFFNWIPQFQNPGPGGGASGGREKDLDMIRAGVIMRMGPGLQVLLTEPWRGLRDRTNHLLPRLSRIWEVLLEKKT